MNFRVYDDNTIGVTLDETTTLQDVEDILLCFTPADDVRMALDAVRKSDFENVPAPQGFERKSKFLQHPVFSRYHSETEMMRYIKRLEGRDLSLTHSMIPLGSCTMKLNAAAEMFPVTWPSSASSTRSRRPTRPAGTSSCSPTWSGGWRDHRVRRGLAPAERRQPGRVRRAAGDPRVPREPRRGAPERLPDPGQRARDEPEQRGDRRDEVVTVACDENGNVDLPTCRPRPSSTPRTCRP
jgi:hypothetical protein